MPAKSRLRLTKAHSWRVSGRLPTAALRRRGRLGTKAGSTAPNAHAAGVGTHPAPSVGAGGGSHLKSGDGSSRRVVLLARLCQDVHHPVGSMNEVRGQSEHRPGAAVLRALLLLAAA